MEQGLGADVHDLVLAALTQAIEGPDLTWAIEAAQAAAAVAGYKEGLEFEARIVGPHLLVTVFAKHLGRRRNWAQARVPWIAEFGGAGRADLPTLDEYKTATSLRIAEHVVRALDGRSR